jgi:plastocyanin
MAHRLFGCLSAGALVAVALIPTPALAATSWNARVGDQTSDAAVQANGFFNNDITVDVGDTVNWSWNVGEIHSVAFLSGAQEPQLFSVVSGRWFQVVWPSPLWAMARSTTVPCSGTPACLAQACPQHSA